MTTLTLPELPGDARQLAEDIISGKYLGASRNIRQINDLFVMIAEAGANAGTAPNQVLAQLRATGDYLAATRGVNTPAIGNAIRQVLNGLEAEELSDEGAVRQMIGERRDRFNRDSLEKARRIAEYGANLLANANVILPFDYSSSMMAILNELAARGSYKTLIVLESRVLDGGRPIANEAAKSGHQVKFTVDMAFGQYLRQVDAILIGAETVFASGDCWNTIGSYPLALLAERYSIPYYVATELIKIDPASFTGAQKMLNAHHYGNLLNHPGEFASPEKIEVSGYDLEQVPASLITSFITPQGVMPAEQVYQAAKSYLQGLNFVLP